MWVKGGIKNVGVVYISKVQIMVLSVALYRHDSVVVLGYTKKTGMYGVKVAHANYIKHDNDDDIPLCKKNVKDKY